MEKYFNAGYFVLKTTPFNFFLDKPEIIESCSGCINFLVFDSWCLSWTRDELSEEKKNSVNLTDEKVLEIEKWTDANFASGEIRWGNALPDLATALSFKNQFFAERGDIHIYTIYFHANDTEEFISNFPDYMEPHGLSILHNLLARTEETENANEEFLGFDFIGFENGGDFHSVYCHGIRNTLIEKFDVGVNQFGLFENLKDPKAIADYLNEEGAPVEKVPWYIVKTKRLKTAPESQLV